MRVSSATALAAVCVTACSLASASTVAPESGVCGLTVTCIEQNVTAAACSENVAADFKLVASSLQGCKDVSYYFSGGQPWPINDKSLFCNVDSVCGKLVPYLRNTAYFAAAPCDKFVPFAGTIATFRDYCRGEPVQQIAGNNGLLRDLAFGNSTKPTPSPTGFNDSDRWQTIVPSQTPTGVTSSAGSVFAPASTVLATLTVAVVVASTI